MPTIAPGDTGDAAGNLIDVLRFWHWLDAEPGWTITDEVADAIEAMQALLGVPATGLYNQATADALSTFTNEMRELACTLPPVSGTGDTGDDVTGLQVWLATLGWFPQDATGVYDAATAEGVQQLQRALIARQRYDGPVDGQFTVATRMGACQAISL